MKYLKMLVILIITVFTFAGAASAQQVVLRARVGGRGYYHNHHRWHHRYWRHNHWNYRD